MTAFPDIFQRAASFDWETLVPIVFFLLAGLAQLFSSMKKKNGQETSGEEEPDVDPMERARQIREEIRRKIEERKQAGEARSAPETAQQRRRSYDPTVPESPQRRTVFVPGQQWDEAPREEPRQRPQPQTAQAREGERPAIGKKADSVRAQQESMQRRLEHQRQRLQDSLRKQKEVRDQARKMGRAVGVRKQSLLEEPDEGSPAMATTALRSQLLSGLRDNDGLRKAVIYREILDPPLGLR